MQEEMQNAAALVHSYVPPSGEKLQAVIAAGGVSISPSPGGQVVVRFADYEKPGDSLTLTLDSTTMSMQQMSVDTWLDEPDERVTLQVDFQSIPDGPSYAASTVLAIPSDEIEVHIANSNYQKLVR
jgi:hypothetical protein